MKRAAIILILFIVVCGYSSVKTDSPIDSVKERNPSKVQQKLLELALSDLEKEGGANSIGNKTYVNFKQLPDSLQNCGGLCFKVARKRVDDAFIQVTGKPLYDWLPKSMATKYLTAKQVFDWTWNINTQDNQVWRSIPDVRGCGSAGAMTLAGLGEMKNKDQIWKGELLPGAVVQIFAYVSDWQKILNGIDNPKLYENLSSYGHSFIFLEYVRDEYKDIIGMKVADQGFMNKIIVNKASFNIWFGANLLDPE